MRPQASDLQLPRVRSRPLVQTLLAAGLAAVSSLLWLWLLPAAAPDCCDASQYLRMARDPDQAVPTPYSYRVLVPRLVHWLGTEPAGTFQALSLGCLVLSGPLVYRFLRRLRLRHDLALLAMLSLLCSRGWTFYLYDPWLSDPAAFLLISALLLVFGSGRARLGASALLLAVCVATRELALGFVAPAYAFLRRQLAGAQAAARAIAVVTPAVVLYAYLLATVPHTGLDGILETVRVVVPHIYHSRVLERGAFWLANTFALSLGVWWPLAFASLRDPTVRWLRWWLVPVFAQLALGGDWSRFALYAFPFVLAAGATTIAHAQHPRSLVVLTVAQLGMPLLDLQQPTLNYPGPSLAATLVLMGVTTATLLADRRPAWFPAAADPQRQPAPAAYEPPLVEGPTLRP
jgi:hypothetical protein